MIDYNNYCHLPLSVDWILLPTEISFKEDGFHLMCRGAGFSLFATQNLKTEKGKTTYIFGKIMTRIQNDDGISGIKGYYNLIHFNESSVEILNDYIGVAKFFYSKGKIPIVASRPDLVQKIIGSKFQIENALLYLLFNYNIFGRTFFENIFYSESATKIVITGNILQKYRYRDDLIPVSKLNEKESIMKLSELWTDIIFESIKDKNNRIALTLTGGYDSRLILAGLLKNKARPKTFTFGNINNADTLTAAKVSDALGLSHSPIKFDYCNSENLNNEMSELLKNSGGLLNPFRIIRIKAICEMYREADLLFLGYGGSEILRGIFPDGLLVSDFYGSYIKTKDCSIQVIKNFLGKFKLSFDDSVYKRVSEIIIDNSKKLGQYNFMTDVLLPMHFGEDMRYLLRMGFDCYSPFMDEDFFKKALKLHLIPLYLENTSVKVKESHFKRIDNPRVSALFLNYIDTRLMKIELNRGYSPNDYIFSKYYAGAKLIVKRYLKKRATPVTELNPWLNSFLKTNSVDTLSYLSYDSPGIANELILKNPKTEYDFIPWIRLWCIGSALKISNISEKA
jgi:asparagine synthetase B (glutamine-hydrolysing)